MAQGAVAHSTPEAEIVAAAAALRKLGIPAMIIWKTLKVDPGEASDAVTAAVEGVIGNTDAVFTTATVDSSDSDDGGEISDGCPGAGGGCHWVLARQP